MKNINEITEQGLKRAKPAASPISQYFKASTGQPSSAQRKDWKHGNSQLACPKVTTSILQLANSLYPVYWTHAKRLK